MKVKSKFLKLFVTGTALFSMSLPSYVHAQASTSSVKSVKEQLNPPLSQPKYAYSDAIRETVFVESQLDTDNNGKKDRIAMDIIRPKETEDSLKVPVIMDASPYYERLGRGNESEVKDKDKDGINEMFPLWYDNYFVPRGYAVAQPEMVGTNQSDGCPTTGGPEEIESIKATIDWLNGRAKAWNKDGKEVEAYWTDGKVGMIGKSYDGTLANGVAATGVEGLETIVPIGAISSWYDYYRYGGIPYYKGGPSGLARTVVNSKRQAQCEPVRQQLLQGSDDATGDYNSFWDERNYINDVKNVKASVFLIHGLNDYNVKTNQFSRWWAELAKQKVPRKIWLAQTGHVDPFDFRRSEWVDTLHQWFDYWLKDMKNDIMKEPMADIERSADNWKTYSTWPDKQAKYVKINLAATKKGETGELTKNSELKSPSISFTDNPLLTEKQLVQPDASLNKNRLLFLSKPLSQDVSFSGTPKIELSVATNAEDTNFTAYLVDYGTDTRVNHEGRGEGITTLTEEDCWGESYGADDACYKKTVKNTHTSDYEIVTRSWMDAQNYQSLSVTTLLNPGKPYQVRWDALPEDYIFKAGHRIGLVIAGSDDNWTVPDTTKAENTILLPRSSLRLPVVGGERSIDF
ncbi:Xaa-Pro dipeptidyl-peptidase [Fictibacillus enclensis]|uniref:Xaa-Pro dipeptidyl-peptidase n=1 Tax=Fictibacillus enclensis TaxID=1017270 RepID=UPI0024C0144E|nr:Xaa-Pro dipeptidyl-peptidase [Fictibacillus enclensis]WHY72974.1 Xaa-Pro dipeptidyl-peptidase [Fictibacillus enclensis]